MKNPDVVVITGALGGGWTGDGMGVCQTRAPALAYWLAARNDLTPLAGRCRNWVERHWPLQRMWPMPIRSKPRRRRSNANSVRFESG